MMPQKPVEKPGQARSGREASRFFLCRCVSRSRLFPGCEVDLRAVCLTLGCVLLLSTAEGADDPSELLFARHVSALLQQKCFGCHGSDAKALEGGLDLTQLTGALKGGDSGEPAVVPGEPDRSPLFLAVTREHAAWSAMPPKDSERLSPDEQDWLRNWIAAGAAWPDAARVQDLRKQHEKEWLAPNRRRATTSGGQSAEWNERQYDAESLWAYQPVRRPEFPAANGKLSQNARNPIDILIERAFVPGVKSAPEADRRTLVRRAYFDLTGLPPSPADVTKFLADPLPTRQALAKVVDQLLASPHYGERMAQHWLDVVRYADSSGFSNDYERGNAWRYRDYVIRSFQQDKPWNQFILEQIAGDEIDPDNPEMLIATGFLRMGPWELTGMEVARVARQRFLDDVVNSIGESFLAQSLQCARCHDHKFDPIPTRDYYSVQAVFATTQIAERPAPFLPTENTQGFDERRFPEMRQQDFLQILKELDEQLLKNAELWYTGKNADPTTWRAAVDRARNGARSGPRREFSDIFATARTDLLRQGIPEDQFPPKLVGFGPQEFGRERVARKGLERLKWELDRYEPIAHAVYSGRTPDLKSVNTPLRMPRQSTQNGELENTCILPGGDPFGSGDPVQPGVLTVLPIPNPFHSDENDTPEAMIAGRRHRLAEWIARPDNPLTTRAIANRVWQWHFGKGLAGNPNNFGSTGKRPTHPELLDFLASELVRSGWSIAALHRTIMNSDVYCRSGQHSNLNELRQLDPGHTSYAVFPSRRLTAEELRDSMLFVSGELNPLQGGIPNRPEINPEVALQPRMVMGTFASAWIPNPLPALRNRRSIYSLKLRGLADPLLEVFNSPNPDLSCEQRESSSITPQVFSLFNGQNTHSRALSLAHRVIQEVHTDEQAISRIFQLTLSREATVAETQRCLMHWREMESLTQQDPDSVRSAAPLTEVEREAVEENTGEKFSFQEPLYSNREYVSDLQPDDVSPRTRALADVCLAVFNSSEFLFVD